MSTKRFFKMIRCGHCGRETRDAEPLSLWVRDHPLLKSDPLPYGAALSVHDLDFVFHRYMTLIDNRGTRDLQYIMFVEAKTNGGGCDPAQVDTLGIVHQLLCTRPFKFQRSTGMFVGGHPQNYRRVKSPMQDGRKIEVYSFGTHYLFLAGETPNDGKIYWDNHRVSAETLVDILRFDIDPDTRKPMEHRRRKRKRPIPPTLFPA